MRTFIKVMPPSQAKSVLAYWQERAAHVEAEFSAQEQLVQELEAKLQECIANSEDTKELEGLLFENQLKLLTLEDDLDYVLAGVSGAEDALSLAEEAALNNSTVLEVGTDDITGLSSIIFKK